MKRRIRAELCPRTPSVSASYARLLPLACPWDAGGMLHDAAPRARYRSRLAAHLRSSAGEERTHASWSTLHIRAVAFSVMIVTNYTCEELARAAPRAARVDRLTCRTNGGALTTNRLRSERETGPCGQRSWST